MKSNHSVTHTEDEYLFGWDPLPGIVSVWASRDGRALVWQRQGEQVMLLRERFRPWVVASTLDDVQHLTLSPSTAPANEKARVTYRELEGPGNSYRYLLSAGDGRMLENELARGASKRLQRAIGSINELPEDYYRVGPVEQYLMLTGRVYFRGLSYQDIYRLQFDLETTALDPRRGRIFMIAVRDSRGLGITLDASRPEDEPRIIVELCQLVQKLDPDVIENHNLFGFDLPFLEQRAAVLCSDNNVRYRE